MPQAVVGGMPTHWREWGAGAARRGLLFHCSLAHSGAWEKVVAALPTGIHALAPDLPGHGKSAPWDEARDVMDQAVEMATALAGAGPVDLVGHSFGAVVALRLAVEGRVDVRSLALYEPVLFAAAPEVAAPDCGIPLPLAEADREEAARRFTDAWGTGTGWETLPRRVRDDFTRRIHIIPAADPALYRDRGGILPRLGRISCPVLLIDGAASPPVAGAICDALAGQLANARRATVAGAGHMGPVTHPAEVAALLSRHLEGVPA